MQTPKGWICYICGRKYGTASLDIHQRKCYEKAMREQALLPAHQRTKIPHPSTVHIDNTSMERFNEQAEEIHRSLMPQCQNCKRRFKDIETLTRHQTQCCPELLERPSSKSSSRPRTIICNICGREYLTVESLEFHQKVCIERFKMEQEKLPVHLRKKLPQKMDYDQLSKSMNEMTIKELEVLNEEAFQQYKDNMVECENCGRKFSGKDRLEVHQRSCKPGKTSKPVKNFTPKKEIPETSKSLDDIKLNESFSKDDKLNQTMSPKRPRTLICNICGREYGTASLKIHQKTCIKKFELEQAKLPKHKRRPLPTMINEFNKSKSIDEFNEMAFDQYKQNMVQCEHCGRKFSGNDRLEIHQRSCRPGHTSKPVKKIL